MKYEATLALQRGVPCAAGLIFLGVLWGRLDLVMLAAPFVVWLAWAMLGRPTTEAEPSIHPVGRVALNEDEGARWRVEGPGIVTAAWRPTRGIECVGSGNTGDGVVEGEFHPQSWGRYEFGQPRVALTDPAAAWRRVVDGERLEITVVPAVDALHHGVAAPRPLGISGVHTSSHRGSGSALATVREFQPGDRLRQIHWRVTARTGTPHVVANHSDRDTDVLIVVDTLGEIFGTDAHRSSLDATVRAMCAITQHYARQGDRVAVHDMGTWIGDVPPGVGQRQALRVADAASRTHKQRRVPAVPLRVRRLQSGTIVYVVSAFLEGPVLDEVVRLRHLGGEVMGVDVLPEGAGEASSLDHRGESLRPEALTLMRIERETRLQRLAEMGIPVARWTGPGSLAVLMTAMQEAARMPRWRA